MISIKQQTWRIGRLQSVGKTVCSFMSGILANHMSMYDGVLNFWTLTDSQELYPTHISTNKQTFKKIMETVDK